MSRSDKVSFKIKQTKNRSKPLCNVFLLCEIFCTAAALGCVDPGIINCQDTLQTFLNNCIGPTCYVCNNIDNIVSILSIYCCHIVDNILLPEEVRPCNHRGVRFQPPTFHPLLMIMLMMMMMVIRRMTMM